MKTLFKIVVVCCIISIISFFNLNCSKNENLIGHSELNKQTDQLTMNVTIRTVVTQIFSPEGDCPGAISEVIFDKTETRDTGTLWTTVDSFSTLDSTIQTQNCGTYYTTNYRIDRYVQWSNSEPNRHAFWAVNYLFHHKELIPYSGGSYYFSSNQRLYCNRTYDVRWGITHTDYDE